MRFKQIIFVHSRIEGSFVNGSLIQSNTAGSTFRYHFLTFLKNVRSPRYFSSPLSHSIGFVHLLYASLYSMIVLSFDSIFAPLFPCFSHLYKFSSSTCEHLNPFLSIRLCSFYFISSPLAAFGYIMFTEKHDNNIKPNGISIEFE